MKPRPGRPPISSEPATAHLHLRTTPSRKHAYSLAANGQKLSAWATHHLDIAANYNQK